ncbi:hypothetical protein G6F62_005015 [Rhizopus arrhizus]|uniref:Uncharacterized protein n=1 Tax=Rhizopus oryzae TaxID=64495 RepID=A0A9P7BVW7_RHIOR|nr:hypothetical protein G6F23_004542 [Rhizopus arrhizus]KAG0762788.1 hypothetical protein G6F24_006526 [Rhizopus arrhizus]KAG0913415.1 hypothetical protein G6F33_005186 [Rhizopus arrhizus]KAG0955437.1 hypothetical protein G6F32_002767 [Rhizopus arrhizus]KAG1294659.1 hypothetical protein G6F66_005021 [Rhizopus arrhizus]
MKFAKYLESQSIPEWRRAYINYKALKKRLKAIEKYRRQHQDHKDRGLDLAISAAHTPEPEFQPATRKHAAPIRTQSSTLENRSTGGQARQIITTDSIDGYSLQLDYGHDTELNRIPQPSLKARGFQATSILEEVLKHASEPEQYFFVTLDRDLDTISTFYDSKEKEAEAKYEALELQMNIVKKFAAQLSHDESYEHSDPADHGFHFGHWFRRNSAGSTLADVTNLPSAVKYNGTQHLSYNVARSRLKKAITEYYRSLELLKSYRILNETGFRKILKKFDKTAGWKASKLYIQKLNQYHWMNSNKIDEILNDTEELYIEEFASGHRRKGMSKLRTPEKDEHYTPAAWRVGFYIGLTLALFARVLQLALDPDVQDRLPNMYFSLQIYAAFFLPILFCLGFAVNTLVWTRCQINYKFIFEFDPRDNLDYHEFAELPSFMLLLLSFIMYIDFSQMFAPSIPSQLCPLIFFVVSLAIMTCPFPIMYYSSRRWLGITLGRIVLSYCFSVEFRDFFIADELNSLAYSFWTISYFFCAYGYHWLDFDNNCPVKLFWFTPILASVPPWWRLLQCLRRHKDSGESVHLVNGVKYITSIAAALVTGYRRIHHSPLIEFFWIFCCAINSIYTSAWDIKMDWGLLELKSKNFLLRDDVVFYRWTYYIAVPINIILRFAWTLNFATSKLSSDLIGFIIAILEIYRRIQWNFFRLENEHINNCGNYRAIKEIPLPFAFSEANKGAVEHVEEGRIQLPIGPQEIDVSNVVSSELAGSFYGRRDFENKQDMDEKQATSDISSKLNQIPSKIGLALEMIQSRGTSVTLEESESDLDDEPDDDDDDSD